MVNVDGHSTCEPRTKPYSSLQDNLNEFVATPSEESPSYYNSYSHDPELVDAASTLAAVASIAAESQQEAPNHYPADHGTVSVRPPVPLESLRRPSTPGVRVPIRKRRPSSMDSCVKERVSKALKSDVGGVSGEEVDMENDQVMDDMSTARRLFEPSESPSSPLVFDKGTRSSASSDDGTASLMDMEDVFLDPESVPAMVAAIRRMLDYVASKPSLHAGSASFMRDYLRTLLAHSSIVASECIRAGKKASQMLQEAGVREIIDRQKSVESFTTLPDELAKHIFSFLDGKNLASARVVCKKWNSMACEDSLWKGLCVKKWRSLESDSALWRLIFNGVSQESPTKWRQIYPKLQSMTRWKCRLMKTGRFICNLSAHQLSGSPLREDGLPSVLIVERRFNILHLRTFVLPEASILYFEPYDESDKSGFKDFIDYLIKRTRAGLALEEQRRFIFIPPCDYTKAIVGYDGPSLIGVVQNAYPPLAPA